MCVNGAESFSAIMSSHKDIVWFQKIWNATGLVCNAFILLFLWSVFAINTCDCTYICLLRVLYCSEVGRFRVGVGLGAPMKVYIYIKLFLFFFFFYKCIQTTKLRQTTENNGGPCTSKSDTKRIPLFIEKLR